MINNFLFLPSFTSNFLPAGGNFLPASGNFLLALQGKRDPQAGDYLDM